MRQVRALRAHTYGDARDVLDVSRVPAPTRASPGEVLVLVACASLRVADTFLLTGKHPMSPPVPYTPGHDAAGVVAEVGAGVTHVSVGDRVWLCGASSGACAELCVCDANRVHALPEHVTFAEAAAMPTPLLTAHRALFTKARVRPGETILVHGASGATGLAVVTLAAAHGCEVVGTASTPEGSRAVRAAGAKTVLDHSQWREPDQPISLPLGVHPTLVIEMAAHANLQKAVEAVAQGGHVLVIGSHGSLDFSPRALMNREATVSGMMVHHASDQEYRSAVNDVQALIARPGAIVLPRVEAEYPLEEAIAGFDRVQKRIGPPGSSGRVVLRVHSDEEMGSVAATYLAAASAGMQPSHASTAARNKQ